MTANGMSGLDGCGILVQEQIKKITDDRLLMINKLWGLKNYNRINKSSYYRPLMIEDTFIVLFTGWMFTM